MKVLKSMPLLSKLIIAILASVLFFASASYTNPDPFWGFIVITYFLPLTLVIFAALIAGEWLSKNTGKAKKSKKSKK